MTEAVAALVAIALVVALVGGFVVREHLWLRRVRRASGDPEALHRILRRTERGE